MRISILFKTLLLVTFIVLSSCSTKKLSNGVSVHKRKYNKGWDTNFSNNSFIKSKIPIPFKKNIAEKINLSAPFVSNVNPNKANLKNRVIKKLMISKLNIIANNSKLENKCDVIILKNGDELSVKVEEINETQIKYRKCGKPTGPLYTKKKSNVLLIRYPDGTKDIFVSDEKNESKQTSELDIPFVYGGMGLLFSSLIPIPFVGLILGCIALFKHNKNPEKSTKFAMIISILATIMSAAITFFIMAWVLIPQ